MNFFNDKIVTIRNDLSLRIPSHPTEVFAVFDYPPLDCSLDSFVPVSAKDLTVMCKKLLSKSCSLDPIPADLLRHNLDLLLPVICKIVNKSLSSGTVPSSLKSAVLRCLLKKPSLDKETLANYRPISNLKMVSKMIEKAVAVQLNNYLSANSLHEPFQSGYKPCHSCETAILRVYNDILLFLDNRNCVAMLLLDLSAAFDTVDHSILLNRLSTKFGIRGSVLQWFKSYLSHRTQYVSVDGVSSVSLPLRCGVPQGSVLGPLLYVLYTSPVADILRKHQMSFHLYADDTQLYIPFTCNNDISFDNAMNRISNCLTEIDSWMILNKLKLNKSKTEFLIFSSKNNPQCSVRNLHFGADVIVPSSSAKNIGVTFDSSMSMLPHIKNTCKSAFFHLRNIAKIRKYLSVKSTEILVHAFITSKLDNYNSVLFGLPKYLIDRLQAVQNASARLVTLSKKRNHITPILFKLHWLPVQFRVQFKILLLTFNALHGCGPIYIQNLIKRYIPARKLRSSSHLSLSVKSYNLKCCGYRSFSVAAPLLWNSLPESLRDASSLDSFKCDLKTYLFRCAYNL